MERHREELTGVQRMMRTMGSLRRRADDRKAQDAAIYDWVQRTLAAGERLRPEDAP